MKMIENINGFGKMQLSYDEEEKIGFLYDIIRKNGIKDFIGKDSPRTPEYEAILEELFPGFPMSYKVLNRDSDRFVDRQEKPIGKVAELVISSRFPIKGKKNDYRNDNLSIILPINNNFDGYLMSLKLNSCYELDVIDDVADILGERENPKISKPEQSIVWSKHHGEACYSYFNFPQVDRLNQILNVYQRAKKIVDYSSENVGVSEIELNVLRKDSLEHKNLFIREGSKNMYHNVLQSLTNR